MFSSKKKDIKQSIEYISKFLIDVSEQEKNLIGITSSSENSDQKFVLCSRICGVLTNFKKNVVLINFEQNSTDNKQELNILQFKMKTLNYESKSKILNLKSEYDLVVANLPSIILNAESIDYLKICDKIFSLERCMYTYYSDFERYLQRLKINNIKLSGIITFS